MIELNPSPEATKSRARRSSMLVGTALALVLLAPATAVTGNSAGTVATRSIVCRDLSSQVRHGAAYRNRTDDNLITSEVLYRLS